MSPLTFSPRVRPQTWIDLSPLTPDSLAGRSAKAIRAIKLRYGTSAVAVGDFFEVSGQDTRTLRFRRASARFVRLGCAMMSGRIEVRGHAGNYLGQNMKGGRISVVGDAGDWVAAGMAGGELTVSGNAGDFIGGAMPGDAHGMSDGCVVIYGSAGGRLGDRMRRGTIIVFGNAGGFTGSGMIAGTILVLGRTEAYTGFGMRRGTIILGRKPGQMLATFNNCGVLKMEFLRLLFKQIAAMGRGFAFFRGFGPEVQRYAGDSSTGGQGEILILLNAVWAPQP